MESQWKVDGVFMEMLDLSVRARGERAFIKQWDKQQRKRQQSVGRESVTTSEDDLENNTE